MVGQDGRFLWRSDLSVEYLRTTGRPEGGALDVISDADPQRAMAFAHASALSPTSREPGGTPMRVRLPIQKEFARFSFRSNELDGSRILIRIRRV